MNKIKIGLEELTSRNQETYGDIEPYIYLNFKLEQTVDNIGIYEDLDFISNISNSTGINSLMRDIRGDYDISKWYVIGTKTKFKTNSKINDFKGYKREIPFKVGFDINKEDYKNYKGIDISGVKRVIDIQEEYIKYVVDANKGPLIGSDKQKSGLLYVDNLKNKTTDGYYIPEGTNETNASLSAIIKKDYLMGIISNPEIKNDVFIDRGGSNIMEKHLRMSEIESLDHLINYGNGYFNVK